MNANEREWKRSVFIRIHPWLILFLPVITPAQPVEVATVVSKPVEHKSRLPGELHPFLKVSLHARVTGFVESVDVDRGSVVRQGQQLAKLKAPEMAAQIAEAEAKVKAVESQRAEAEAKLVASQSTYERLKAASATPGVVAGNEVVLAEKAVDAARALVRAFESAAQAARASVVPLREMESYLNVTAPFDGVITERLVHPGALVGPGAGANAPLLALEQNTRLRLVVAVPEAAVAGMAKGARFAFSVPAHPGQKFQGQIARIPQSLDPKTRTMPVELDVDNARGQLAPGMYAEVEWTARRPGPSLLVPPTAIVTTTERSFVVRVREGRAEWVTVSRGTPAGELVEVLGSLHAGDVIVKRASDEIREGTKLEPRK